MNELKNALNINNDVVTGEDLITLRSAAMSKVYTAVTTTMGPDGSFAVLDHGGRPKTTKDGASVARAIKFDNRVMDLVAQIMTEAAVRTERECGDGTTTTIFLTTKFFERFKDNMTFRIKRRLDALCSEAIDLIEERALTVDVDSPVLRELAMTTSNNDVTIVDKVLQIYRDIPGVPDISYYKGVDSHDIVSHSEGLGFVGGYAHPSFSPNGSNAPIDLAQTQVVLFDCALRGLSFDVGKFLASLSGEHGPVLIIAKEFDNHTLELLSSINARPKSSGQPFILPVRISAVGTAGSGIIADIAAVLGIQTTMSFDAWQSSDYKTDVAHDVTVSGGRFTVGVNDTTGERVAKRVKDIERAIKQLPEEQRHSATANLMHRRISNLVGGQVSIHVGGETKSDIHERYDRFVDVGSAVKSALINGVLPGIGYTLAVVGEVIKSRYPGDTIAAEFAHVLGDQLEHLMGERYSQDMVFVNLATGEEAKHPEDINVWDAKLATVTALRAGLTTAIILASLKSAVVGGRSAAVSL